MTSPPPPPQLDKLVEKQRETHRRMLEQLLLAEQAHKQALFKLEDEKRNHGEFMKKSDEFTNLLEQERERSEQSTLPQNRPWPLPLLTAANRMKQPDQVGTWQLQYRGWPLAGRKKRVWAQEELNSLADLLCCYPGPDISRGSG